MGKTQNHDRKFDPQRIRREMIFRLLPWGIGSLVIAAIVFGIGLLVFPGTIHLKDAPETVDWGILEGITSLITLSLIIGGGVFVFVEYINNEVQQTRESAEASFNIYENLYTRLTSPEDTASRRWILHHIPMHDADRQTLDDWVMQVRGIIFQRPPDWREGPPPGQTHVRRVLNTLDFIGFVAENYWNMENELVEWMSPLVVKVWERIGPYVEHEVMRRDEPDFFISAREFGDYCVQWRYENKGLPPSRIIEDAL